MWRRKFECGEGRFECGEGRFECGEGSLNVEKEV